MSLMKNKTFQKYFVPGIVFQSLVIAGGYGTGRELVEFFLQYGTMGGLLGITCVFTGCFERHLCRYLCLCP